MAWVRIHDGAMTHPKVLRLNDRAFRLWVWGLTYAQQHLTDGWLPALAIPAVLSKSIRDVITVGLWESAEADFQIHDYLDWNDSREIISKKRSEAKDRMAAARDRSSSVRANVHANERGTFERTSREVLRGVGNSSSSSSLERERERKPSADSKWPVFKGNRLVVFEWMLTKMQGTLGQHAGAMEWDVWLDDADRLAMAEPVVASDWWPWLQAELLAYAKRQGWAVAVQQGGKQTLAQRMASAVANIAAEG